jgi:hypothetical protein
MPRYNFYAVKGGSVPSDLNAPVKKMLLEDLKCPEAVAELELMEKHKNCGSIGVFYKDSPKSVEIKTNYGMVEGYDLVKTVNADKHVLICKKHIKNPNLSMKKEG